MDYFNFTLSTNAFLSVVPTGDYQLHIFYYRKAKGLSESVGNIKLIFSMLTSIKDTFG